MIKEARFALDSPVEGGVSCELVSEMPNSLLAGKIQGISADSGLGSASDAAKKATKSVSYEPIPYAS